MDKKKKAYNELKEECDSVKRLLEQSRSNNAILSQNVLEKNGELIKLKTRISRAQGNNSNHVQLTENVQADKRESLPPKNQHVESSSESELVKTLEAMNKKSRIRNGELVREKNELTDEVNKLKAQIKEIKKIQAERRSDNSQWSYSHSSS